MEVLINKIISCEDDARGKFGPQKKIVFKDARGTIISGWVNLKEYEPGIWVQGGRVNVEIKQNGKYTNFTLPKRPGDNFATPSSAASSPNEEVLRAMRLIYKKLESIEERLSRIEHPNADFAPTQDKPSTQSPPEYPDFVTDDF